jgi:DNA-binding NarL/FixJ family response regulator
MKILIVDEHVVVRAGTSLLLQEIGGSVDCDEAGSGYEALRKIRDNIYDVVLLDLTLADISGFEVLEIVKRENPGLPVVAVSMHTERQYAVTAYSLGADGYISKESAPSELLHAMEKVVQGKKFVSEHLINEVLSGLQAAYPTGQTVSDSKALSVREIQVSKMLASGASNKEIAWQLALNVKTVSTYKMRILKKLNLTSLAGLIKYEMAKSDSHIKWPG